MKVLVCVVYNQPLYLKLHATRSAKIPLVLILNDLSAGLNIINDKTLLSLLTNRISGPTLWWFVSYLNGQSYQVKPTPYSDSTGVPQVECLHRPLLFPLCTLLYFLSEVISSHDFSCQYYTDGTQLIIILYSCRHSCFCMDLNTSGRHLFSDASSSPDSKSQQASIAAYPWRGITMSRFCYLSGELLDHTIWQNTTLLSSWNPNYHSLLIFRT